LRQNRGAGLLYTRDHCAELLSEFWLKPLFLKGCRAISNIFKGGKTLPKMA
jgi:hypothetical protein